MKKVRYLGLLAVPVFLVLTAGTPAATAGSLTMPQATSQQTAAQTFTGTIVKAGDTFKLEDTNKKVSYVLDDTQRASTFDGKKVKVTGTLDSNSAMIHVESIEAAS